MRASGLRRAWKPAGARDDIARSELARRAQLCPRHAWPSLAFHSTHILEDTSPSRGLASRQLGGQAYSTRIDAGVQGFG